MCQNSIKSHTLFSTSFNLLFFSAQFLQILYAIPISEIPIVKHLFRFFKFSYIYVKNGMKDQIERSIVEGHLFWSALSQCRAKNIQYPLNASFALIDLSTPLTGNELSLTRPIMRFSRV